MFGRSKLRAGHGQWTRCGDPLDLYPGKHPHTHTHPLAPETELRQLGRLPLPGEELCVREGVGRGGPEGARADGERERAPAQLDGGQVAEGPADALGGHPLGIGRLVLRVSRGCSMPAALRRPILTKRLESQRCPPHVRKSSPRCCRRAPKLPESGRTSFQQLSTDCPGS